MDRRNFLGCLALPFLSSSSTKSEIKEVLINWYPKTNVSVIVVIKKYNPHNVFLTLEELLDSREIQVVRNKFIQYGHEVISVEYDDVCFYIQDNPKEHNRVIDSFSPSSFTTHWLCNNDELMSARMVKK